MDIDQLGREITTSISTVRAILASSPTLQSKLTKFDAVLSAHGRSRHQLPEMGIRDVEQSISHSLAEIEFLEAYCKKCVARARSLIRFHENNEIHRDPPESIETQLREVVASTPENNETLPETLEVSTENLQQEARSSPDASRNAGQSHSVLIPVETDGIPGSSYPHAVPYSSSRNAVEVAQPSAELDQTQAETQVSHEETGLKYKGPSHSNSVSQNANTPNPRRILRTRRQKGSGAEEQRNKETEAGPENLSQSRRSRVRKRARKNKWCICDDPSPLDMIGCDNPNCPVEWYHMKCVGFKVEPTGKRNWICPKCRNEKKRKKN